MRRGASLVIMLALLLPFDALAVGGGKEEPGTAAVQRDESLRRGESRPTLDPQLFRDPRIRKAYQVARDIPWVLDSIYCYCFCETSPSFRHVSLLTCYVDNHAAM